MNEKFTMTPAGNAGLRADEALEKRRESFEQFDLLYTNCSTQTDGDVLICCIARCA